MTTIPVSAHIFISYILTSVIDHVKHVAPNGLQVQTLKMFLKKILKTSSSHISYVSEEINEGISFIWRINQSQH